MLPLIAHNLLFSINILGNPIKIFNEKMIIGIEANKEKCNQSVELSLAMCTALVPILGYDKSAEIAYKAYEKNKTIRDILIDENILDKKIINEILDPIHMIKPKK